MIEFGIKDVIDILLVASLLFYVYRLMKESRSLNIFVGIMLFVLIWLFVSQILEMRLLGSILDKLVSVGVIALIVIFQEDIRRFLYEIGSQKGMRRLVRFFHSSKESQKEANKATIIPIVMACMSMAKKYVGGAHRHRTGCTFERYHGYGRRDRCKNQSASDREHLLQELASA